MSNERWATAQITTWDEIIKHLSCQADTQGSIGYLAVFDDKATALEAVGGDESLLMPLVVVEPQLDDTADERMALAKEFMADMCG